MKFLVDAQLPRRLAQALTSAGHKTINSVDLPQGNAKIRRICVSFDLPGKG